MTDLLEGNNPYTQGGQNNSPETIPLDQIIKNAIQVAMMNMNVFLPAMVTKVRGNQKVDIQILLQRRYTNGNLITLPVMQNVMVNTPMGADYSFKLPIAVGDTGAALFCDRSLDVWSVQGGTVDPADIRNHDLSDPVFVPGLYPFNAQTQDTTTDLVITNGKSQFRAQKSGAFLLKNLTSGQELLNLLDQLLDTLINNTFTLTELGPQPFITGTIQALTTIRTNLDTLKGS